MKVVSNKQIFCVDFDNHAERNKVEHGLTQIGWNVDKVIKKRNGHIFAWYSKPC